MGSNPRFIASPNHFGQVEDRDVNVKYPQTQGLVVLKDQKGNRSLGISPISNLE
jgi:hypothetical protein